MTSEIYRLEWILYRHTFWNTTMSDGFACFFDALPEKYAFKLTIKRKRSCTSQLSLNPCLFSTPYAWHKV